MRLQLNRAGRVAGLASLALVAALGRARAQQQVEGRASPLGGHVALDYGQYADTDHVFVETPSIRATVLSPTVGWSVGGHYLVDVVSAASADIVSTASRQWTEVRQEGGLEGSYKPGTFGVQANAGISSEPDYLSLSAGGAVTQDFANKNATWLLGYAHGHDVAGRTGTAFSVFSRVINRDSFNAALSLVLGPSTVLSLVGDLILDSGDQSKPYRYIPLFAPGTSVPRGASVDLVNSLRVSARPLEQLPLSRQRYAATMRLAHRFHRATLRVDERVYADSWLMKATTTDARYLLDIGRRVELGPHARLHAQTAVDFWQRAYVFGPGLQDPALRTGDRELGPLVNETGGATMRIGLGADSNPGSWVLGFDLNATLTQYLDDIYLTGRLSALGGVTLEAEL